jgi:hypothetical protein
MSLSFWNRSALALLFPAVAYAHVVSTSTGELRITGRTGVYELRIPAYEIEHTEHPETALLDEIRFAGAQRTSSECNNDGDWFVCRAGYTFSENVTDKIEVDCTVYRATVPNHIHLLYAVQGQNSDQQIFDQNTPMAEMRFHPPSLGESLRRDGAAGARRLLRSLSAILFLAAIALAARNRRDALILGGSFLAAEWLARPVAPFIPIALSPDFLEAVLALTAAYLAGELLFFRATNARWALVPLFGLFHGLPFVAFPALYLAGAMAVQALLLIGVSFAALQLPDKFRRPAAGTLLAASLVWFCVLVFT